MSMTPTEIACIILASGWGLNLLLLWHFYIRPMERLAKSMTAYDCVVLEGE